MKVRVISMLFVFGSFSVFCNFSCTSDALPGGYQISASNSYIIPPHANDPNIIFPKVLSLKYDDSFICAMQKPDKELSLSVFRQYLYSRFSSFSQAQSDTSFRNSFFRSPGIVRNLQGYITLYNSFLFHGCSSTYNANVDSISVIITDSVLTNDPTQVKTFSMSNCYWILKISNDSLYGPLTYSHFLDISKNLKLNSSIILKP